jgi:hypothetical protein
VADITELEAELIELVRQVPAFAASGFSVFDVDDLANRTELQALPIVGVIYDGALPKETARNVATGIAQGAGSVSIVTLQFTVVIAVQYHYAGQDDTKPQATMLLKDLRNTILGYRGVNTRPWRFVYERPEPEASGDGLVFYSQVWQTDVPVIGNTNNSS